MRRSKLVATIFLTLGLTVCDGSNSYTTTTPEGDRITYQNDLGEGYTSLVVAYADGSSAAYVDLTYDNIEACIHPPEFTGEKGDPSNMCKLERITYTDTEGNKTPHKVMRNGMPRQEDFPTFETARTEFVGYLKELDQHNPAFATHLQTLER
jgi:hypothetical protein